MAMVLNDHFDRVVCINLDSRPDRWSEVSAEFIRHHIVVERFAAIDRMNSEVGCGSLSPAERGCLESHLAVIASSVEAGYQHTMIFEDDVEFDPDFQRAFQDAMEGGLIPAGWDLLYLGGAHVEPPRILNRRIARVTRTYTTSHYGISLRFASEVVQAQRSMNEPIDVLLAHFQSGRACFTFEPAIAWQKAGFSDIRGKHVDYSRFMKPGRTVRETE